MKRRVVSFITMLALFLNLCPIWALAAEPQETVTLIENTVFEKPYVVSKTVKLDTTAQYTLTGTDSAAIQVTGTGVLTLSGTVVSENGAGVEVQSGGQLYLEEPINITGATYALDIAEGATVRLAPGTYSGTAAAIRMASGNYADLLGTGYAFLGGDGNPISPELLANATTLTVGQCTKHSTDHTSRIYACEPGKTTHTWTCKYCKATGSEPCTFSFVQDGDGTGTCADCGNGLAIDVNQDDLSNLVYDGTVKPEQVRVTVTLTDGTVLTKGTDFNVNIEKITNAGQATVTVTGITFNGTFVKTYTVEPATPGISWAATAKDVNYDGQPVEASDLPAVNKQNIVSGDEDSLTLKYQYTTDGTNFTDGLPTDAGTYQVKAYLEGNPNYVAVETATPLELTINPINPIVTAPTPTTPMPIYNRTAQELVTAGTLDPAAERDGLTIEFATSENGPWSTDIPTGTNAYDSYRVWYTVVVPADVAGNYNALDSYPAEIANVRIQRKAITPVVTLSQYSYLYDSGYHEPTVTVIDDEDGHYVINPLDNEYTVSYENNRDVSTDDKPAKVVVTDKTPNGGNYDLDTVTVEFKITSKTQDTLSITNKPDTFTYGDKFTLQTSGGSGNGDVTWEITNGKDTIATVDATSGQVTITGHGSVTVKATKSGADPDSGVVNYEDATAVWTFTADKKPVTATVTAEDKDYDGNATATIHAVVKDGDLAFPGDKITITGLTGTFDDENAGVGKTVTVVTTGATITGNHSEHYDVSFSATTVQATIRKAVAEITTAPVPANLIYNGTAQALIATGAVVDPADVPVEYSLSETGTYSTDFPEGTNAGTYTVWYRVQETPNYTGLAPASVNVTIDKKSVNPTITLDQDTFTYDGAPKEPVVTLYEADGATLIPAGEYTVAYSGNVNVGTATVTATAKADGNYTFANAPVTATFTIEKEQAKVLTAPKAAGLPLVFSTYAQELVTAGTASGGTMVYSTDGESGPYSENIPTKTDAGTYNVYYKVQGDSNHSDSDVCAVPVTVTIAPKTVKDPTIELYQDDGTTPLASYTYDGNPKEPNVVVKDGSDIIAATEYNVVYSDNTDAGHGTVNITDKPGGNYTVTGSATFVINKANIVFDPVPTAATLTYNGTAQELLVPGTTTGGTVQYALNSATSTYSDAIPTGVNAGTYNVYYKVTGDKNHNDLPVQGPVAVTIARKQLTDITIELTPNSFAYDGTVHLPMVTVKDGDTVLPVGEYTWKCTDDAANEVTTPTQGGTYTITVSDKTGGNYDLTNAAPKTADFIIGKAAQAELVIEDIPATTFYGDTFTLKATGGSGDGALKWSATGPATMNDGTLTITGVGTVNVTVIKEGNTNYQETSAHWTFTAAPKPVTASIVVDNKDYDGTTAATVASADITADLVTVNGTTDTVTIDPTSITAAFDTPNAGTGKTVTLDTSKVNVAGDAASKYAISYPATVTADITRATTTITSTPAAIPLLTYSGQPQALVTAGQTNVGFLVYSLDGTNFSREIPTGTNARTYNVYYKVDGTADYTGVAANTTPISVTIVPKNITPKIELSETSYKYDGTQKAPKVTLKDGDTVIHENQYTVTWEGTKSQTEADMLRVADTYKATITNVANGNYTFNVTASVEITPAEQAALHITGQPEHVYYGNVITTLGTEGGTGDTKDDTVKWSVTSNGNNATIEESTGKLTITGTGAVTVRAERTVPNYGTVGDNWNFTVEPKPVTAEVSVASKTYDGTTSIAAGDITANVKAADLVGTDTVTLTGLKGTYADPNVGTGKTITLDSTNATADNTDKYAVSYPATVKGDITPKGVNVTVTLSDYDLKTDTSVTPNVSYYEYDGTAKEPKVTVKYTEDSTDKVIPASNYTVEYSNNKNVSTSTEKAAVTVTAKDGGNYTFTAAPVNFEIRSAAAVLTSSPQAKDLTYEKGTEQELVTVGTASGGTVMYKLSTATDSDPNAESGYGTAIPKAENAGTYTVYYKVQGDDNHNDTAPGQVPVTIKPKEITPAITLSTTSYVYDGTAKRPDVTVKDGNDEISGTEYSVSYRDNVNAGTATVTVSDANGGNYIVNGSVTFEITKATPTVTAPTAIDGLQYNGELQDLVTAGVTSEGTVVYSVNGGNYSSAIPTASAEGTYTINWKVQGDANHSDTAPVTLSVEIAKNTVNNPTITLSSDQFKYNGSQQKPTITVSDDHSRVIPEHEYTVSITGTNGNVGMVDVDTYTIKITTPATSNYVIADDGTVNNTRTFKIVPADQETISITGTPAQVRYGDAIQLGVSGGTGSGTVTWTVAAKDGSTTITTGISSTGLLTVKDVNTPITVTVTRTKPNYGDVSATWEFTAAKKPVTAEVTVAAKNWDGTTGVDNTAITATVKAADLAFTGDNITITDLTGAYDNTNVGTGKTVTLTGGTVGGTNADKYDVTIPATATASILAVAATVDTEPAANTLTYDASQAQELLDKNNPGRATGGTMAYSLDGNNFTPAIPKAKDAGTYTVYYKAQGDQNHTDSAVDTVNVTIAQQSVTPQIELSPPSGQYDGTVQQPSVTVRDGANNVIPASEYKVTYVTDGSKNWKDRGTYTVKVENITGGNYEIKTATKDFTISTSAQAPLEIVNKPGQVYYGDTFTLSATGGSSNETVTWSSSDENIAHIDDNGFVTIKGTGPATITATKAGGGNYDETKATYPLNAHKKPVTVTVTADDREYKENDVSATIHFTWNGLVGTDKIDTKDLVGTFDTENVGTGKTVTVGPKAGASLPTSDKYDFTIPATTTASITKAVAAAPSVTAVENLEYNRAAQALVKDGDANTLYSASRDGVYSSTVPTGTNAGTYTVWYKAQGDVNHNDSEPQSISVTISPKPLTVDASNVELSGNDLKTDTSGTGKVYYYEYDGTEKTPTVVIKDGSAVIPASEYTVTYSNNKNATTADKKATVTITDKEGSNYVISVTGTVSFEIHSVAAVLTGAPQDRNLTYNGAAQQLVTVGTATGGHIEYALTSAPAGEPATGSDFSATIPTGTNAGTYTVDYQVVGEGSYSDGPTGSVTVTIQPKTVISPKITVTGGPFTYNDDGTAHTPTVTVEDGGTTIDASEYTLSYQNNVNAGIATVIVADNNGGNYTVNGTATFQIGKAAATVGTPPAGKTGLKYNGSAQELITAGSSSDGTMVYSLDKDGEYSAAIPTGKGVDTYTVWYKVQGDGNHEDTEAQPLTVSIAVNDVTNPIIQVTPASVKYTGEKQEPAITVKDDNGLLIDGSEYEVTYKDTTNNNTDLTAVGTYTVTVTGKNTNYSFSKTATFTITQADQTPLTITGTWERVYYGDTIQLGTTGGIDGGTVTWKVTDGSPASIDTNGLLKITGVGSVTVTATSTDGNYKPQTATWNLYADKKPVTAVVTAKAKDYDGTEAATVTATLQDSDFVGTDSFTITLTGCTFEDANAGADKKVTVVSTNPTFTPDTGNHENYAISYPNTVTASITKANVDETKVTAPEAVDDLKYTGLPLALVTEGSTPDGTMEYSLDGRTYSASLPTGTNAGNYDVWYRVKGDGNHNDAAPVKLTETNKVTIAPQEVDADKLTIEFTPSGASYDGQEHKPEVIVKDSNGRVIPAAEYTVGYGSTNWKDVGDHTVTITGKTDGNYSITGTPTKTFTILPAGQSPLSIAGQPGTVQYGDVFTLSANGGSGTGAVTWESSDSTVAFVNSQNGRVEIKKAGGPVTITVRKAAGGGYAETTATWTFSAEKRPATAIVTARNKPYDGNTTATVDVTWKDGDLLNGDTITLSLTGAFDDANVGTDKIVRITGTAPASDKYAVTFNNTTTASITATQATVSGVQSGPWTYNGSGISLLQGGSATHGTIVYSRNGVDFMETSPTETNAGKYTVYYKARGNTNYADSDVRMVEVTIQPKTVSSPTIDLASDSVEYDGTVKEPDVVRVLDGANVIPAGEYTVSYSNNINVGTTAKVTITDVAGGNYTVSGSRNFAITAGAASLTNAPQPNNRTYDGSAQPLVTAGSAVNGKVVYSLTQGSGYSTSIPVKTDADTYTVWYKVQGENGAADTTEAYVTVTIARKPVTPTILVGGQSPYSVTYTGSAQTPAVTVIVDGKPLTQNVDYTALYSNNINVGTATVTVQSTGGNHQFYVPVTFEITKDKATFTREPLPPLDDLYYTGEPQELVRRGTANNGGIVLYSLDNVAYSTAIPKGTERGAYTVYAKIQASELYAESDVVILDVEIGKNVVTDTPDYDLSATNFPYTGSEVQPTVTLWDDDGYEIDSSEYTLRYSNNIAVGTATIKVTCKRNGNYSFNQFSITFQIVDATQTPLAITGKQDTVYYGDALSLGTSGGGSGTVTWSSSDSNIADIGQTTGVVSIKKSGSVTITATKGSSTDTWTFAAKPKPVTATVYAADKVYDGNNTATLTVALSGLLPDDSVSLTASGSFIDEKAGTNKNVLITGLNVSDDVRAKYDISYNSTTTASITPKPASVSDTGKPILAGSLTYNGGAQPLLTSGGTAEGGNLMYSLDGQDYRYKIPTGTDADTYTVWYKVEASDENHKDSAPVKLGDVIISADPNTPTVQCNPSSFPYDGTEKTPTIVVLDSTGQHIIPESEYTVVFPTNAIDKGSYTVTVKDKTGGNYQFSDVTGAFEIVASSQAPLSITDKPAHVYYGDTFYLSALGGTGSGAIKWSIAEDSIATINDSGAVTVKNIGSFTVKAYRAASGGYSDSNTDSVTFVAQPKPVTPVVTAKDKSYNGNTDATLTASIRPSDKVNASDDITLTVQGVFASADAGVGKRVELTGHTVGGNDAAKYTINWPDSVTATINRVDTKIAAAPAGKTLTHTGSAQELVSAGTASIGDVVYSLNDQNGPYSTDIPMATDVGTYTVWYKVADSVNYNGVPAASVTAEIQASGSVADTPDTDNTPTLPDSASLQTTIRDGTANTVLSSAGGSRLVQEAVANQSQNIVIQPEITGSVTKTAVSIPASTVSQINSQTDAALTVASPIADVTIPNEALDTLGSAGGAVNVVTEQVDGAVALTLTAGGKTVDSVPGGVTLTVPAEDAGPGTVAVRVNQDGTRETIQKSVVKDGALAIPLDGSATVEIVDNSKDFDDVSPTDWEADAVAFASAHELFGGTSDTTFSPDQEMSRGMLATVLYRLEGLPDQDTAVLFEDVDSDAWYTDGVVWAAENGIVNGYGEGQFRPNDSITREQFAVMLWRYAGSPEAGSDQGLAFTDADQASGYAQQALRWAVSNGIISGYPNGQLNPRGTATRAQAAQMLKNFMENT